MICETREEIIGRCKASGMNDEMAIEFYEDIVDAEAEKILARLEAGAAEFIRRMVEAA